MLGLELRVKERGSGGDSRELRFFDPIAGEDQRTHAEEREGRIRAERELAMLRARLAKRLGAGGWSAPSGGT